MVLNYTQLRMAKGILDSIYGRECKLSYQQVLEFLEEYIDNGDDYLPNQRKTFAKNTSENTKIFNSFVEYCLYRNLANYDSMLLLTSDKGCISDDSLIEMPRDLKKYPKGVPVKDLIGKENFYVYSYNIKENKLEVKKAKSCEFAKEADVYEVETRNGYKLTATGDHPFLLMDGTYKQLKDLVWFENGETRKSVNGKLTYSDRLRVFVRPNTLDQKQLLKTDYSKGNKKIFEEEYRFIASRLLGNVKGKIVHHKDRNHFNNNVDNLEILSYKEHNYLHEEIKNNFYPNNNQFGKLSLNIKRNKSIKIDTEEFKNKCSNDRKKFLKNFKEKNSVEYNEYITKLKLEACCKSTLTLYGSIIKSIKHIGIRKTYDIVGVEDNRNFIANNFIVSNTGKSSFAMMLAKEWCRLIGIKFSPERHMAYSNQQVMDKVHNLRPFEPLICLTGDQKILVRKGKKIKEIEIEKLVGKNDFMVRSYDKEKDTFEWVKPDACVYNGMSDEIFEIELEDVTKVKATKDHKFYTKDGIKKLSNLTEDDELIVSDEKIANRIDGSRFMESKTVPNIKHIKIKAIKKIEGYHKVYDIINAGKNHNFICNQKVVTKNCDEAIRFASCVTGDCKIQMPCDREKYPDGVPIKELEGKKDFYVYSMNVKTNMLELKKAKTCIKVKQDQVYEVEFTNGNKLKCTKEHKLVTIDGEYKTLEEFFDEVNFFKGRNKVMKNSEWLLPTRFMRFVPKYDGFIRFDYNTGAYETGNDKKAPEHRFIMEQLGNDIKGKIVHHLNNNQLDNSIENLEVISKSDHNKHHGSHKDKSKVNKYYDDRNDEIHERKKILNSTFEKGLTKERLVKKSNENKKAMFKIKGLEWKDVYEVTSSKGGLNSSPPYIKTITKLGIEEVYDIIEVEGNHNFIGNLLLLSNSEDWNKAENKELKKVLGQVRTKHLFYILCFPLKLMKLDKTYLESYVNYWIDLFGRGTGALYVKDKNPYYDAWRIKEFQKLGSYTEFTQIPRIQQALSKHPNFWYIIKAPKPPAKLYNAYLKVREYNIYDDQNVMSTINKADVIRAVLLVTLKEILQRDSSLSNKRLLLHLENTYGIKIDKKVYDMILNDAMMLVNKVKEEKLGKFIN